MTNDLFPDCKQDSPRLAWMKRHGITTNYDPYCDSWMAQTIIPIPMHSVHFDEEGALQNLAVKLRIPLWNEEQFCKEKKTK